MTVPRPYRSTLRLLSFLLCFGVAITVGCGDTSISPPEANCSEFSSSSLVTYDKYSAEFLNEDTRHPTENLGGQVVWGTRYYLESLLTAYQATKNPKYLQAFEDTGTSVMGLAQTISFLNVADPSAPGGSSQGPHIMETGWPTYMGTFGVPISIPTVNGKVALYAQSLYPRNATGPNAIEITSQPDGSVLFAWTRSGKVLDSYPVRAISDLYTIAAQPLDYGQSIGRIHPTGLGLPMPGTYDLGTPLNTIWHAEQTGGILLPFARFLLIAKDTPGAIDPSITAAWQTKVLAIASGYVDHFIPDGSGGYTLRNPQWMAHTDTGTDAPSDYVFAEISLRIVLYELANDPAQLSLARGLLKHQVNQDIPINANGWLVVREWPDIHPWSSRSGAPAGSIWDSLSYDANNGEDATEGGFFVEMLHLANQYGLVSSIGLPASFFQAQGDTFHQYLLIPNAAGQGLAGPLRSEYPQLQSSRSDSIIPDDDPFVGSGYLEPETSDSDDWIANWQWMGSHGGSPQGWPIGFMLRAWARSESAMLQACKIPPS